MQIYVISLPNAIERRNSIKQQLDTLQLPFEFIDAFYGKNYIENRKYYDPQKAQHAEGRQLSAGEVGCALSHNYVYSKILEKQIPYALILEDDVIISKDVPFILQKIEKIIQQGQLITLERCDYYNIFIKQKLILPYLVVKPIFIQGGSMAQAAGYIISHRAAQEIVHINVPVYFPADNWFHYEKYITLQGVIPSMTLIRQNTEFESATLDSKKKRNFEKHTLYKMALFVFKNYTGFGRFLVKLVKKILKRT